MLRLPRRLDAGAHHAKEISPPCPLKLRLPRRLDAGAHSSKAPAAAGESLLRLPRRLDAGAHRIPGQLMALIECPQV